MPATPRNRTAGADLFRPVNVGRASEDVVRQIKDAIHAGKLRPGDGLPSERELTGRLGVSRVTVRDALRTLEATGLVEIRVGARGGAFVTAPEPDYVGEGLANMLLLSSSSPEDVTEARMIFELGAIPLVCERRTKEDLADLEEICTRSEAALKSGEHDVRLSAEFHIRLAASTHNTAVALIVDSFQGPLLMSLARAKDVAPRMGKQGAREHRELVEAIRKRDAGKAHDLMERHLGRTAARLHASGSAGGDVAE
ncbi:MAG: FCD domain-containing protein [Propionibacteriales bacterium]|nr:FCD domain-containing protein [Propionibacteriales bacterium]